MALTPSPPPLSILSLPRTRPQPSRWPVRGGDPSPHPSSRGRPRVLLVAATEVPPHFRPTGTSGSQICWVAWPRDGAACTAARPAAEPFPALGPLGAGHLSRHPTCTGGSVPTCEVCASKAPDGPIGTAVLPLWRQKQNAATWFLLPRTSSRALTPGARTFPGGAVGGGITQRLPPPPELTSPPPGAYPRPGSLPPLPRSTRVSSRPP